MDKSKKALFASLALAAFTGLSNAQAAPDAQVYVIHAIPGQDLGLAPDLPVDVSVDGACALPGFTFGEIVGPISFPEGTSNITISLADADAPCSEAPVISVAVPFTAGETATIIAHLDANGAPTASKFVNDLSPAATGDSRILLHHTAAAPAVDLRLLQRRQISGPRFAAKVPGAVNGDQAVVDVPADLYQVGVLLAGTETVVLGPAEGFLGAGQATLVYVVGSASSGSLTIIVQRLPLSTN